jgi:hypothetical protein
MRSRPAKTANILNMQKDILTAAIHVLDPVSGFGDVNGIDLKDRYSNSGNACVSPENFIQGFVLRLETIEKFNGSLLRDLATTLLDRKIGEHSVREWSAGHDSVAGGLP